MLMLNKYTQNRTVLHFVLMLILSEKMSYNFLNQVLVSIYEKNAVFDQNKGHVTHNICIINAHEFIFERDVQLMNDDTCC